MRKTLCIPILRGFTGRPGRVLALGLALWGPAPWGLALSGCSELGSAVRDAGRSDAPRPAPGTYDECGNGFDDDGDGAIDEDCPCATGESQPCWDGARAERGVGACGDGVQQCSASGSDEFGRWLACTMSAGPGAESCEGGGDEDCDGAIDEGCPCAEGATRDCAEEFLVAPCSAGTQACRGGSWTACEGAVGPMAEVCGNGVDDDCDGDSDDPALCLCAVPPRPEECGNGVDDDCDGEADEGCVFEPCPEGLHRVGAGCVASGGIRPIAPLSLGDTSLLRPTLRYELPAGADGAVLQLCEDRACTRVLETLRTTGTSGRPSAALPASSVVFWRGWARMGAAEDTPDHSGPTWLFHTPARDNSGGIDTSYHPHLDVNGDGFDDIVVGGNSTASVFHGSPTGLSTTAAITLVASEEFRVHSPGIGRSAGAAGDVNGDGFGDLFVADTVTTSSGSLAIHHGSPSGISATASLLLPPPASVRYFPGDVETAGDVNLDGYADIAFAAHPKQYGSEPGQPSYVYHGGPTGLGTEPASVLETLPEHDTEWVTGAGDVNGDGFSDLAAVSGRLGRVPYWLLSVYPGSATGVRTASTSITFPLMVGTYWRPVLSEAGDVNGDGFTDIIFAGRSEGDRSSSAVSLYHGSAAGIEPSPARTLTHRFSYLSSLASGRDTNGDGFADILVGDETDARPDTVFVYRGSASGIEPTAATGLEATSVDETGGYLNSYFGSAVAGPGDIDGDGFADIAVGSPTPFDAVELDGHDEVHLYHGGTAPVGRTPWTILERAYADPVCFMCGRRFGRTLR
jgi:hypothetical protein